MDHDGVVAFRRTQAGAQRGIRHPAVFGAVEEIWNHVDVARHADRRDGVGAQTSRNRGHGVGLFDGERHDAPIRRIAADQRDVGAMQRRHGPWREAG